MTTDPRPLTANTRSIASRGASAGPATDGRPRHAATRPRRSRGPRPRAPPPSRPDAARTGGPGERRRSRARARPRRHLGSRRASSTRSAFVTTASPSRDPERVEQRQVLERLGVGPSSAATTSSAASISPAPTSMLPISRSCPGTSTKSTVDAVGSARCAYPTSIVMPAPPLLGQPVGVDAGERPQERRLAVVDVPGRADDDAARPLRTQAWPAERRRDRRGQRGVVGGLDRPEVEDDRARLDPARRPPGRRSGGGQQPVGRVRPAAPRRDDGSIWPGSDPPPTVASTATTVAGDPTVSATAVARAREILDRRARAAATPGSRGRRRPPGTAPSVAAIAASITLSGRIARASGSLRSRATRSARPTMNPACGPADQLVAAERHEVRAVGEPLARASARAPGRTRRCRAARRCPGRRRPARRGGARARRAPADRAPRRTRSARSSTGWTRRTSRARPSASGLLEVGDARPVRRPDLDQLARRRAGRSRGSARRRRSRPARRG